MKNASPACDKILRGQRKLKVLHVLHSLQRSGAEMNLLQSVYEWQRLGFSLDVLATATEIGPLADSFRDAGYGVYHYPLRSNRRFVPSSGFCTAFINLCRKNRYDIVHIHTEQAYFLLATLSKLAATKTVVRSVHNAFSFKGLLRARKQIERAYARSLSVRFGFVSPSVRSVEIQQFKNPGVLIQNWFDVEHFRPPTIEERAAARKSAGFSDHDFVIMSLGNCNHAKNHSAAIRALGILPSDLNISYLHVGREDSNLQERKLVGELGLTQKVRFVGQANDPRPYFWAADLFVMSSLWEGLGIAALEAAGTALPLILTDVDGLRDVASQMKWTVLVPPTPEALSSAIFNMYQSDRQQLELHALEDSKRARTHFSPSEGVRLLIDNLYQIAV